MPAAPAAALPKAAPPPLPANRYADVDADLCEDEWPALLDPSDLPENTYDWVDVRPRLPALLDCPPWTSREGWIQDLANYIDCGPVFTGDAT